MSTNATGPDLSLGVVCTRAEWQMSESSDNNTSTPALHCLTRGQSIGLSGTTEAAFISILAVLILFMLIVVSHMDTLFISL